MKKCFLFCSIFLLQNTSVGFAEDVYRESEQLQYEQEQLQNIEINGQDAEQYENKLIEEEIALNKNDNDSEIVSKNEESKNETKNEEEKYQQDTVIVDNDIQDSGKDIRDNNVVLNSFKKIENHTNKNSFIGNNVDVVAKKQGKKSSFGDFIEKWFIPEQNPAFGDTGHALGIQVAYDLKRHLFPMKDNRELYLFAIQYSGPNKFLGVHGRTSLGLSYIYGQDHWAKEQEKGKYNTPIFELIQEFVIGNKYFYLTCGVGLSWVVYATANYELKEAALVSKMKADGIQPIYNERGELENYIAGYGGTKEGGYKAAGITNFNVPITASLGHRFDNGLAIEIMWKHYSNGHVADYNSEINTVGISFRYTFGTNKKI